MSKVDVPAAKKHRIEQQKNIRLELKAELEKEKQELFDCAKSREKAASIVVMHHKRLYDSEMDVKKTLYARISSFYNSSNSPTNALRDIKRQQLLGSAGEHSWNLLGTEVSQL